MPNGSKKITINTTYVAKNGPWPVDIEFFVPTLASEMMPVMETITLWLENAGFSPRFDGLTPNRSDLPRPGQEGTYGAVGRPPDCPVHHSEMAISQYKTNDGKEQWYCPQKDNGQYCKQKQLA